MSTRAIWVVTQAKDGGLDRGSREALAFGRRLAAEIDGTVIGVALGAPGATASAELATLGVAKTYELSDERLGTYSPGAWVDALAAAVLAQPTETRPAFLLCPHSYRTVDFLGRLAFRLRAALIPEVTGVHSVGEELRWRRPIMEGKMQAEIRVRQGSELVLASIQGGACQPVTPSGDTSVVESLEMTELTTPDRRVEGVESANEEGVDLSAAEVVVAVGRGLGDPDKLEPVRALAQALGGELGASRPVVDSGWLERELQIGSSGQTVAPKLYLALGISGAIQHLVGMRGAQCVVAINKDASAPIFQLARYGVVGDLHELVPAIRSALD